MSALSEVQIDAGRAELRGLGDLVADGGRMTLDPGADPAPWDVELSCVVVTVQSDGLVHLSVDDASGALHIAGTSPSLGELAEQIRSLADDEVPVGYHAHFDPLTGLYPFDPNSTASLIVTLVS